LYNHTESRRLDIQKIVLQWEVPLSVPYLRLYNSGFLKQLKKYLQHIRHSLRVHYWTALHFCIAKLFQTSDFFEQSLSLEMNKLSRKLNASNGAVRWSVIMILKRPSLFNLKTLEGGFSVRFKIKRNFRMKRVLNLKRLVFTLCKNLLYVTESLLEKFIWQRKLY